MIVLYIILAVLVLLLAVFQHLGHLRRHFHLHAPADLIAHAVHAHKQVALVPAVVLEQPDSYVFLVHFSSFLPSVAGALPFTPRLVSSSSRACPVCQGLSY